jgi:hypothetical protein
MREATKKVYYCDHCKKHGLSRPAMEKHERVCTMNPDRVCRWTIDATEGHADFSLRDVIVELQRRAPLEQEDIDWLRSTVTDTDEGCPVCMLAALRQSGLDFHHGRRGDLIFDYDVEVQRFRDAEREHWRGQEWRDLQASLL